MRIGLLGGSFDPAHDAHLHVSLEALKRLGLDQVWWLVSPGNPLKTGRKPSPLAARVAAARALAKHPKIAVTGFEGALGSNYTIDTVQFLKRLHPSVRFVWLMGADNLAAFHRWRAYEDLFRLVPIAVFDRPGHRLKALAGQGAQRFAAARVDETDARGLAHLTPPAWALLALPLSGLSSTSLRAAASKRGGAKSARSDKSQSKSQKTQKKTAKKTEKKAVKQVVKPAKRGGKKSAKPTSQQAARSVKAAKTAMRQAAEPASKAGQKAAKPTKAATKQSKKKSK
jgi:nicotinate-nucleotide adenylyltransferase